MRYPVTLAADDNGTVLAVVPDIPGAHSFGDDEAEALARALDAAESALMAIMADREEIPTPGAIGSGPFIVLPPLAVAKIGLYRGMRARGIGKAELARRLGWHMPQVDRVLSLAHASKLEQIEAALRAVGLELVVAVKAACRNNESSLRQRKHGRISGTAGTPVLRSCPFMPVLTVWADWDAEAGVWVVTSDDIPGLIAEADTEDDVRAKLRDLVPELLAENVGISPNATEAVTIDLIARRRLELTAA